MLCAEKNTCAQKEIPVREKKYLCAEKNIRAQKKIFCAQKKFHAPNLSNIFAFACINRIKNFASKTPSDPEFAPVSVKRSNLSEPEFAEVSSTG